MESVKWADMSNCSSDEDTEIIKTNQQQKKTRNLIQKVQIKSQFPEQKQYDERPKKKYLTDNQLIQKIKTKQIQQNKTIKAVNCLNEESIQFLKNYKMIKNMKEIKKGTFIINFQSQQNLISFITAKINNKCKFFLQPFINYNKNQQKNQHFYQKNQKKKQYKKQSKKKQKRYNDNEQEQCPTTKQQNIENSFQLKQQILTIFNKNYSIDKIIEQIKHNKVTKQFSKIRVKVMPKLVQQCYKLCQEIENQFNYGLQKLPNQKNQQDLLQLILQEGVKGPWKKQISKEISKEKIKTHNTERQLNQDINKYFYNIEKTNLNVINKGFKDTDYVKMLKQFQNQIFFKWKKWVIKSVHEQIPQLLFMSWNLIQNYPYLVVQLKVGSDKDKPYALIELQIAEGKQLPTQKRPKVDVSLANSHLNN